MTRRALLPWLPNLITLARLFSVPGMVYFLLLGQMAAAFWIFVLAGLSDALDGLIAKRWHCVTTLGTYLDPLADKVLLVAAFVTLGLQGHLPLWLVILVVTRDLMIVGGALLYQQITRNLRLHPLPVSKLNTGVQILLIAVVLAQPALGLTLPAGGEELLVWLAGATTLASGFAYVFTWGRKAMQSDEPR